MMRVGGDVGMLAASDAVAAYIIGTVAAFWLVERTLAFGSKPVKPSFPIQ